MLEVLVVGDVGIDGLLDDFGAFLAEFLDPLGVELVVWFRDLLLFDQRCQYVCSKRKIGIVINQAVPSNPNQSRRKNQSLVIDDTFSITSSDPCKADACDDRTDRRKTDLLKTENGSQRP